MLSAYFSYAHADRRACVPATSCLWSSVILANSNVRPSAFFSVWSMKFQFSFFTVWSMKFQFSFDYIINPRLFDRNLSSLIVQYVVWYIPHLCLCNVEFQYGPTCSEITELFPDVPTPEPQEVCYLSVLMRIYRKRKPEIFSFSSNLHTHARDPKTPRTQETQIRHKSETSNVVYWGNVWKMTTWTEVIFQREWKSYLMKKLQLY